MARLHVIVALTSLVRFIGEQILVMHTSFTMLVLGLLELGAAVHLIG